MYILESKKIIGVKFFFLILGTRFIARSGLKTLTVRMADKLRFSVATKYSTVLCVIVQTLTKIKHFIKRIYIK